jgi:uncharacterized membrane protein
MYLFLKLVHLTGVVMFLGNISLGIFWKYAADKTEDPAVIAHTMKSIISSDRFFTIPGVVLILAGGFGTAAAGHFSILGTGWILWSLTLLIVSGLAFTPLSAVQQELRVAAEQARTIPNDLSRYKQLSRKWDGWGAVALITPLIAFVFMILKPALPAFHR